MQGLSWLEAISLTRHFESGPDPDCGRPPDTENNIKKYAKPHMIEFSIFLNF
jgi:hypothetical protein